MNEITSLTAIVVDDELKAIENLKKLIGNYCPKIRIINEAMGVEPAALIIDEQKPDVLFLDIAMPRKNGFELLNIIQFMPLVVFVTAYEKYALRAIKASAVDFLLKPVDINDLKRVEEKLERINSIGKGTGLNNYNEVVGNLVTMLKNPGAIKHITLPDSRGYNIVAIDEVLYLEGLDNYTTFHINNKPKVVVSKTLKDYEDMLEESGFFRIHKSSIINLHHLKKIKTASDIAAVMSDDSELPVSRRRASELVKKAREFMH